MLLCRFQGMDSMLVWAGICRKRLQVQGYPCRIHRKNMKQVRVRLRSICMKTDSVRLRRISSGSSSNHPVCMGAAGISKRKMTGNHV